MLGRVPWGKVFWSVPLSITFVDNVASVVPTTGLALSPSLPPTSWAVDFCVVTKWHKTPALAPGDVVALANPSRPGRSLVKRLAAVESDMVRVVPGDWRIEKAEVIRRGCCWVVDDNEGAADDSRTFGQVPMALLQGKVHSVMRLQAHLPIITAVQL